MGHDNLLILKWLKQYKNWPIHVNIKYLRGFLGLEGYCRRFIKGFGSITWPNKEKRGLYGQKNLLRPFNTLKEAFVYELILAIPYYSQIFIVETNDGGKGMGAVLMLKGHPIPYIRKSLAPIHQVIFVYNRELLALIFVVSKWSHYLLGSHSIVKTDQKSLNIYLINLSTLTSRLLVSPT